MTALRVPIERLPHAAGLDLPEMATAGSAGLDLVAAIEGEQILRPGERGLVPTGLVIALPAGVEAQIRPRSGLALKHGVTVLNAPGTIDSDYRGEIGVLLINMGSEDFIIRRGERIAQMVVASHLIVEFDENTAAAETDRGGGGFGSTGTDPGAKRAAVRAIEA
jgi:dUTP pyrophosphatase